jgi:hypothetical protein
MAWKKAVVACIKAFCNILVELEINYGKPLISVTDLLDAVRTRDIPEYEA